MTKAFDEANGKESWSQTHCAIPDFSVYYTNVHTCYREIRKQKYSATLYKILFFIYICIYVHTQNPILNRFTILSFKKLLVEGCWIFFLCLL